MTTTATDTSRGRKMTREEFVASMTTWLEATMATWDETERAGMATISLTLSDVEVAHRVRNLMRRANKPMGILNDVQSSWFGRRDDATHINVVFGPSDRNILAQAYAYIQSVA